ncbi:MAG: alpha-L-arabinofuranosidase [Bacteroidaceae bacterium]|nr:alpha-L-arabinofuranosidase [Bacteroidaceae bacterium]
MNTNFLNRKLWLASVLALGVLTQVSAQTEQRQLTIDVRDLGIEISPTLSGIFFEDINQSLDGGICAQMIQNNSFQAYNVPDGPANEFSQSDTIFFGWTVVNKGNAAGQAHAVSDHPLIKTLERKYDYDPNDKYDDELRYVQYCVRFDIESAGKGFGIAANGYGITPTSRDRGATYSNNTQRPSLAVEANVKYDLGLYLQGEGYKGKVTVYLEDINGQLNSNIVKISKLSNDWKKYTGALKALRSVDSRLVIVGDAAGTFFLNFVTLLPEASHLWKNGKAGPLRKDMMEALANLHPKFMRFPGGCASEGPNYFGQVFWKNSIGKPEERIGFRNHWGYWTSQYVGFYEYFLMAESLGASPLPVLNNGVTCQFVGHSYIAPLETEADRQRFHDIFVKDALDLIEFCNGPVTSTWGKVRAQMGHPAPFNLKYLGIGNENQGKEFWERFDIMYKAVKAQYPDIIIVSTAGARDAGREFDNNYAEIDAKYPDTYVDEHYYKGDDWFFSQGNRYAPGAKRGSQGLTYDRSKPTRVFVGEFANNGTNNAYQSTLAEAAYWLSLERNSDMVVMAAYAPLFCKKGYNKWGANLIWFDNRGLWRTTNYYYQQLFSVAGDRALKPKDVMNGNEVDGKIYTSSTIDTKTGKVYVKFVNAEAKDKQVSISLNSDDTYTAEVEYITSHDTSVKNQGDPNYYSSHPDVDSSFSYHEAITPQTKSIGSVKGSFTFMMPENAVGVLRLTKK